MFVNNAPPTAQLAVPILGSALNVWPRSLVN
jgi:hypothetical protein